MYSHYVCGPLQIQKRVEIETLKERFGCRYITCPPPLGEEDTARQGL